MRHETRTDRIRSAITIGVRRNEDGSGGDKELFLEGESDRNAVVWGLNNGAEGFDESTEGGGGGGGWNYSGGVLLEEDEEVELEVEREVFADDGGESELKEESPGVMGGGPAKQPRAAVVVVVD